MSWTVPRDWVDGEVITASIMNTHVRDNVNASRRLLGYTLNSATTGSTISTSFVDASAAILVVTFTVPASGSVLVVLQATTSGATTWWGLREASSDVSGSARLITTDSTNGARQMATANIVVSGLTPGDSHTYKWSLKSSGGASSATAGPASLMEVWQTP